MKERKITDIPYSKLIEILKKRYDEKFNIQTELHRFFSRTQGKDETLSDYMSALKLISQKCKWICTPCEEPVIDMRHADSAYQRLARFKYQSQIIGITNPELRLNKL